MTRNFREILFIAVLFIFVLSLIGGCSTISPVVTKKQFAGAEAVCIPHQGFMKYIAKKFMKDDAICKDGTVITNWPEPKQRGES